MPDFNAENILFGSSFDSTAFVAGVTKSVESLKLLGAEQKKLQSVLTDTSVKLTDNSKELFATQRAYDNLDKGSKNYIESQTKLKTKIDELKTTSTQLNTTWANQKAALEAFNSTNAAAIASFNKLGLAQKELIETGNIPITPVLDPTKITGQLQNLHDFLAKSGGEIDFTGFEGLHEKLASAGTDIEQVVTALNEAKTKLATLDPNTQEFQELNEVVQTGEKFISDYDTALKELGTTTDKTGEKTVSMRTRIKLLREEMTRLEDAGKENTEQYKKVQLEAARLTDQFQDQQQAVKALSSDTKALDFGLAAINAAGAGMQVYLGVVNLLGLSEEDAAEAQRKLLAVMNLVQGAQQLATLLTKQNTIAVIGGSAATRAYAAVNGFLTTSFGAAATAATALRGALITTGIGALVVGLGFLIAKLVQMHEESVKAAAKQKQLNDVLEESKGEYTKAVVEVDTFKEHLRLAKEGVIDKSAVLKEYNEGLGKTMGAVNDLDAAEKKVAEGGAAYIQFTLLKAAANIALGKAAEKAFEAEQERRKSEQEFATIGARAATFGQGQVTAPGFVPGLIDVDAQIKARAAEAQRRKDAAIKEKEDSEKELTDLVTSLNNQAAELAKQFHFDFIPKVKIDKVKAAKEVEDVFKQQLLAMQAQLADINKSAFISADTIAAKVEADFNKAREQILVFFKEKKLTTGERDTLLEFLGVIKQAQLSKDMAEFTKNVIAARKQMQDQLDQLAFEQSAKNINNIQDSFEREAEQNKLEFDKQTAELIKANQEQQKAIEDNIFLAPDDKAAQIAERTRILNDELLAIQIDFGNKQRDLALKILDDSINDITKAFKERDLRTSELEQKQIKTLATDFANGTITYKQYQDGLTRIELEAKAKRNARDISGIEEQIKILQDLVDSEQITDKSGVVRKLNEEEVQKLKEQIISLREQLLALNQTPILPPVNKPSFDEWIAAYKSLADSILGFIEQINAAEQQRLDRSIALQQTRVENARFIAEKGNAEYLELEQKRLDALIQKREAAAQKEIAINNALAASGAIVAGISAIAKAAETGGVIAAIAAAVAVIAAIASIYKFVSTLQPPVAEFYEGTTYVEQGRHKSGKDTIPARVNIGEAIIPTHTNKDYHPAVKAIYDRSIPAKELNDFVEDYSVKKYSPKEGNVQKMHITDGKPKETEIRNKILNEFVRDYTKEKDITKEHSVSSDVLNEIVKFYKSEDHLSYNEVLSKFVEQYSNNKNTVASLNVFDEFVKEFSQFSQFDKSIISNDVLHEYIKEHEHSTYAKILQEFLITNKSNEHSVTALKEFVKNYQTSAIDKIHESFITDKELSVSKINEFVKKHEHTAYADVLHEFVKQSDSKRISVQSLNEFVEKYRFSEFANERLTNDIIKKVQFVSRQDEKIHEQFISNKKSISTDIINKFIEHSNYANVLSEFLKQSDVINKTVSVNKLNEFVSKQNQSAIDKVHEQFISKSDVKNNELISAKNISTDTINRFIEETSIMKEQDIKGTYHENSVYANILNEFIKQTDKKVVSVDKLNEFVRSTLNKDHKSFSEFVKRSNSTILNKEHESFVKSATQKEFENVYQNASYVERKLIEEYYPAIKAIHERSIPATAINEFVKHNTNKISTRTLNEFVNKHSDESVSHITKENKTNEKLVSIDKVNEFIKNKQDTRVVNETHVLSDFIAHYPVTKIPQLDYTRLHTATERSYTKDATLSTAKIEQLLTALNENVSQFDNVKMVFDENGFAMSMLQAAKKEKLKWKS